MLRLFSILDGNVSLTSIICLFSSGCIARLECFALVKIEHPERDRPVVSSCTEALRAGRQHHHSSYYNIRQLKPVVSRKSLYDGYLGREPGYEFAP
jgi:hypothetical protein